MDRFFHEVRALRRETDADGCASPWSSSPSKRGPRALSDPVANVRLAAARALAQVGAPEATARDPLVKALGDPDSRVRAEVARTLGRLARGSAVEATLTKALADPDPAVRAEANRALGRVKRH